MSAPELPGYATAPIWPSKQDYLRRVLKHAGEATGGSGTACRPPTRDQPLIVAILSSARAELPPDVPVMTAHVDGATTLVWMGKVTTATPVSLTALGGMVTLAGTVAFGLLLES